MAQGMWLQKDDLPGVQGWSVKPLEENLDPEAQAPEPAGT